MRIKYVKNTPYSIKKLICHESKTFNYDSS